TGSAAAAAKKPTVLVCSPDAATDVLKTKSQNLSYTVGRSKQGTVIQLNIALDFTWNPEIRDDARVRITDKTVRHLQDVCVNRLSQAWRNSKLPALLKVSVENSANSAGAEDGERVMDAISGEPLAEESAYGIDALAAKPPAKKPQVNTQVDQILSLKA